jgi:hypothetical protein
MTNADTNGSRIGWLERPGGEFPYYNFPITTAGLSP